MKSNILLLLFRMILKNFKGLIAQIYAIKIILSEEEKRRYVSKKYHFHNGLPTIDLLDLIPDMDEDIEKYTYLDETSRITDIAVIKGLCRQYPDCNYLEIGSWRGESLVNASRVASRCVSVSLSQKEVMERWGESYARVQRLFSMGEPNITHIEHDSHTFDYSALDMKFDVIFIDGDHSYEGVKKDTQKIRNLLRGENSVILWHDCGKSYEKTNWEVLAGILDGCSTQDHRHLFRISNTLLAIYTQKEFKSEFLSSPQFPNKTFNLRIKAEPFNKQLSD